MGEEICLVMVIFENLKFIISQKLKIINIFNFIKSNYFKTLKFKMKLLGTVLLLIISLFHFASCASCDSYNYCMNKFSSYGDCNGPTGCCKDSYGRACYYTSDCGSGYCRGDTALCYSGYCTRYGGT